jgi:hypothetical protein
MDILGRWRDLDGGRGIGGESSHATPVLGLSTVFVPGVLVRDDVVVDVVGVGTVLTRLRGFLWLVQILVCGRWWSNKAVQWSWGTSKVMWSTYDGTPGLVWVGVGRGWEY